jgi:regulator of Ty1 transposition protein 109
MKLAEYLKHSLPSNKEYKVLHLQSNPRETHPLVTQQQRPSPTDTKTIKVQHFIALVHDDLIFFALEVFIYVTINHTEETTESILFISKVDTNGQNHTKVRIRLITTEVIKYLLQIPIDTYLQNIIPETLHPRASPTSITHSTSTKTALKILISRLRGASPPRETIKPYSISIPSQYRHLTKITLFTRPEPQYLFPNSGTNPNKHCLTGDELLKWWLQVLDAVLLDSFVAGESSAKLRIPAEEESNIARNLTHLKFSNWSVGDIFSGANEKELAVYRIPLLPDDPKTRFLEHLVVEGRFGSVSVDQFWNELQIRQEFRLGVTVSVIGVEGHLKRSDQVFETGLLLSHRDFKKLKTYVVGEDYSTDEGAVEACGNVVDYLEYYFEYRLPQVVGAYKAVITKSPETKRPLVQSLNSNLVRKRPKKENKR